jgi:hypothetical protein
MIAPETVKRFKPPKQVRMIAEMTIGCGRDHEAIAEACNMTPEEYTEVMRKPMHMAWVANYLHNSIEQMLGICDMAIFEKASKGNVAAYNALMNRYGQLTSRSVSLHAEIPTHMDLENLTDKQLEAQIVEWNRKAQAGQKVIDVETEEKEVEGE